MFKESLLGTSLAVQWVKTVLPRQRGTGSFPGQGTRIPHASGQGQNQKIYIYIFFFLKPSVAASRRTVGKEDT